MNLFILGTDLGPGTARTGDTESDTETTVPTPGTGRGSGSGTGSGTGALGTESVRENTIGSNNTSIDIKLLPAGIMNMIGISFFPFSLTETRL